MNVGWVGGVVWNKWRGCRTCLSFRHKLGHVWSQNMQFLGILMMSMREISKRHGFFSKINKRPPPPSIPDSSIGVHKGWGRGHGEGSIPYFSADKHRAYMLS